jgi:hypothetical protein
MSQMMETLKKHLILAAFLIILTTISVTAYLNSPAILAWVNPQNGISIIDVSYPTEIYRTQRLPIVVTLQNLGGDSKSALVEVISKDDVPLKSIVSLREQGSIANASLSLPVTSYGDEAFTVKVSWIGPGGLCKLEQDSIDKPVSVLAAEYDTSSTPKFASKAQEFDWTLTTKNIGNAVANLTIQIGKKDPLIISSSDTQQITNIKVGETRSTVFHFIVPSSADLGNCKITASFTTSYETVHYEDFKETTSNDYTVTIQESPIKTQIDNANYLIGAVLALGSSLAVISFLKKRRK